MGADHDDRPRSPGARLDCVEIAVANDGVVGVRDSKNPNAILEFAPTEWAAFTGGVRDGEFDL
ncbi:DUF397 domain-containing protein [Salinispora arenicola]|uniref:DUF397 domain-containing protein n=1 Tax=Salinispora arenicola TaxID=168697 RepID=UPI00037BCD1E|nr:DUF397 domain-containing protein [Salinispora arenicola]